MRHYQVTHRTTYTYPEPVASSYGQAMLLPRRTNEQVIHRSHLDVTPVPRERRNHEDFTGNRLAWFHVTEPHTVLEVVSHSIVSVDRPHVAAATLPQLAWDQVAALVRAVRTGGRPGDGTHPSPLEVLNITSGSLPSDLAPLSDRAQALALDTFVPGQPLASAVAALSARIHRTFEYRSGSTTIATPLEEVLETGRGVCHDFAHVMIAALRALGLSAMYVSGYLETSPPGRNGLRGVDATHAWVAVWFPGAGWVHLDPTNNGFIDDRYVILGWGRDFRDVSPLRGIVYTEGSGSRHSAEVELRAISADELGARLHGAERA